MIFWLLLESAMGEEGCPWRADFLSARERERFERLRFPRRRREWLLGRYAAKALLSRVEVDLGERPWSAVEILNEEDGAPIVLVDGQPRKGTLSLSHRAGMIFVAWKPDGGDLGVDVEQIEERKQVFEEDYFTVAERGALSRFPPGQHALAVTLLWSLKESALKALRQGLRLDTRRIEVLLPQSLSPAWDWRPCTLSLAGAALAWSGQWRRWGDYVLTVVSAGIQAELKPAGYIVAVRGSLW